MTEPDVRARLRAATPLLATGTAGVVAGGLVAAATAPSPSEHGSWTAAYLVLVAGVAQIALALGQVWLAPVAPARRVLAGEYAAWNVGNAAVIAGTLAGIPTMLDAGGVLLVAALALFAVAVRGRAAARGRWLLLAYRALVVLMLVSIPVGLVLDRVRG